MAFVFVFCNKVTLKQKLVEFVTEKEKYLSSVQTGKGEKINKIEFRKFIYFFFFNCGRNIFKDEKQHVLIIFGKLHKENKQQKLNEEIVISF